MANLTSQSLIIDLIQEELLIKDLDITSNNIFIFYVCKRLWKFKKLKKNPFPKANESSNSKFDLGQEKTLNVFYCKKSGHVIKKYEVWIANEVNGTNINEI